MKTPLQSAWVRAAKQHITENHKVYGRGASVPSDDAYLNFIDKNVIGPLTKVGLSLIPTNYKNGVMQQFINGALDKAIKEEESSDTPMPISKNARLKVAHSLKESLNAGFEI